MTKSNWKKMHQYQKQMQISQNTWQARNCHQGAFQGLTSVIPNSWQNLQGILFFSRYFCLSSFLLECKRCNLGWYPPPHHLVFFILGVSPLGGTIWLNLKFKIFFLLFLLNLKFKIFYFIISYFDFIAITLTRNATGNTTKCDLLKQHM